MRIDREAIRAYYSKRSVIVDELHGTSRGYLTRVLRDAGVPRRNLSVMHGGKRQRGPDSLESLGYANPEWPFIAPLAKAVGESGASLGVACDTDADRFGVVDADMGFVAPNLVLPILTDFLLRKGYRGKVLRTVTTSRLIDRIASQHDLAAELRPAADVVPDYLRHPFYQVLQGSPERFRGLSVFLQPVGIKYVIAGMLVDEDYRQQYWPGFRGRMLIGGEESSGLTTLWHLPDKDGVWGNLLIVDAIAEEKAGLAEQWERLVQRLGRRAWFRRSDVDATERAKEQLLDHMLCNDIDWPDGFRVDYKGGIRFDMAELCLTDRNDTEIFLEVRASGTEPLNRVYVEVIAPSAVAPDALSRLGERFERQVLGLLGGFVSEEIRSAANGTEVVDCLAQSSPHLPGVVSAVRERLSEARARSEAASLLRERMPYLEHRNRETAASWMEVMGWKR